MLKKKQVVTLRTDISVRALKGRTQIKLGSAGDEFRVIGSHESLPGYYYMRTDRAGVPPLSVFHFTEVNA